MIEKNTMFRVFAEKADKFSISVVRRDCEEEAIKFMGYKEILAITGVRGGGKTYLMYLLMKHLADKGVPGNNILYLNFEDERLALLEPSDLERLCSWFLEFSNASGKLYFFLDEIQNVPLWEKWLSRMYEKVKFVISGSNSRLLSSEIATALTGRSVELTIYPFSFKEFVYLKEGSLPKLAETYRAEVLARVSRHFQEYIEVGGFPEVLMYGKKDLLQEYYKAILLRDIIRRYAIRRKDHIERISLYLMSNISSPISLYSLAKDNAISVNTIKNYLGYIENSFLLSFMKKFDYSLRKQNANPRKVYAVDVALARQVSFKFSEDRGRVFENIVFTELKRRKKEAYYHKNKYECDFVIKEGLKIRDAIQVCYELNEDTQKRELNGLIEAMDAYRLDEGAIITAEQEQEIKANTKVIRVMPLWKWLLEA
ncbi:TPA: ATP-binding protein [Candidatus Woesearchaeota archaeon]|nr:ATP-binding protein [Candidatus Woesearchaeota archaeon]